MSPVEEFYNRVHNKADGKFGTSGTGGGHYKGRGDGAKAPAHSKGTSVTLTKAQRDKAHEIMARSPNAPPKPGEAQNEYSKRKGVIPPKPGEKARPGYEKDFQKTKARNEAQADYAKRGPKPPGPNASKAETTKYTRMRKVWQAKKTG